MPRGISTIVAFVSFLPLATLRDRLHTNSTKMSSLWAEIVATYSPYKVEFVGTFIVQLLAFWLPATIYVFLDFLLPSFSARHKIQPAVKPATGEEIRHCVGVVLRNQAISLAISAGLIALSQQTGQQHAFRVSASSPSAIEFVGDLLLCFLGREVLLYYAHRLLHTPRLYRTVHKAHHRFTAPFALAAQYAHPLEHLLANMLPVVLPAVMLRVHVWTLWAFLAAVLVETSTAHSGYDFFHGLARMHDAHHERSTLNFGAYGLMDWLHGTDDRTSAKAKVEGPR